MVTFDNILSDQPDWTHDPPTEACDRYWEVGTDPPYNTYLVKYLQYTKHVITVTLTW